MLLRVGFLLLSMLVLSACVSKSVSSSNETEQLSKKEHKIESEELRILMRELSMVVYDRQKSELDRDDLRRRYALNLADVVKELAYKVEHIPQNELGKALTDQDKAIYERYAHELYLNGEEIGRVAQKYEMEKLDGAIAKTQQSCDRCHALLRD
ncbi:MAG: hypothetical protein PF439_12080 [Helicobacteraceae bacterium]|jgi:cytochrome c556|nr:hypothetical protein [Helicobacteraceae bacterium]